MENRVSTADKPIRSDELTRCRRCYVLWVSEVQATRSMAGQMMLLLLLLLLLKVTAVMHQDPEGGGPAKRPLKRAGTGWRVGKPKTALPQDTKEFPT